MPDQVDDAWHCLECGRLFYKFEEAFACEQIHRHDELIKKFTKHPYCFTCGKKFKKVDEYSWKATCECAGKDMQVSIG